MKWLAALGFSVTVMFASGAQAASFDCSLPKLTGQEQTICAVRDLNDMDVEMATTYRLLSGLFGMGTRGNMADNQRAWLKNREKCGTNVPCIRKAYRKRLDELQSVYNQIDRPI